jgi:xylose isomerase
VDLRRAFNQVRILDKHNYGQHGEWVGLDVKAMRTQKDANATLHLSNSLEMFHHLLEISRSVDDRKVAQYVNDRNYEGLDLYIMKHILGK